MAQATLNQNNMASTAGNITVYRYHSLSHEYLSSSLEYLVAGVGLPANTCIDAPGEARAGFAIRRNRERIGWEYIADHRGKTVYYTATRQALGITELGDYPAGVTELVPNTPYDTWNGSQWVTDSQAQQQVAQANADPYPQYAAKANILPAGVPVPWPVNIPPAGWLKCNGAAFDTTRYPLLAAAYPTGILPDLRGEFIRGWDDARGVDAGRVLLSLQEGTIVGGFDDNDNGEISAIGSPEYAFSDKITTRQWEGIMGKKWILSGQSTQRYNWWAYASTRPRNIAFNYIVRAA